MGEVVLRRRDEREEPKPPPLSVTAPLHLMLESTGLVPAEALTGRNNQRMRARMLGWGRKHGFYGSVDKGEEVVEDVEMLSALR
jgi:hypothetical protein